MAYKLLKCVATYSLSSCRLVTIISIKWYWFSLAYVPVTQIDTRDCYYFSEITVILFLIKKRRSILLIFVFHINHLLKLTEANLLSDRVFVGFWWNFYFLGKNFG